MQHDAVVGCVILGAQMQFARQKLVTPASRRSFFAQGSFCRDDLIDRVAAEPKREIKIYLDSGWPRDNYEVTRSMGSSYLERVSPRI